MRRLNCKVLFFSIMIYIFWSSAISFYFTLIISFQPSQGKSLSANTVLNGKKKIKNSLCWWHAEDFKELGKNSTKDRNRDLVSLSFSSKVQTLPDWEVESYFILFLKIYLFLFLAALGLCCCARAFSSCGERGLLFVAVRGLLIGWLLLLQSSALGAWALVVVALGLSSCGSWALEHKLSSCGTRA